VRADVVVVGLGSMGAAAAHRLAEAGLSVVGLDRFDPPHGRGAHAGGSRIIRAAYMEGPDYVPLVLRSYDLWRELEAATGESLLTVTGGLMLGRPDSLPVAGALEAARRHGLAYDMLDPAEVRRRFPAFTPADDEVGVFESVAGLVRPERAITTYLRLARSAGATLRTNVAVRTWRETGDGVTVDTSEGEVSADRLVLAPGAWAPGLTRLTVPIQVQRRIQHFWGPTDPDRHDPGAFPVWIWQGGTGLAYGLPTVDGQAKAAFHDRGGDVSPDAGAAEPTEAEVEEMRDWLRPRLPGLAGGRWLGAKPCLYALTPDGHFVLGRHPHHSRVVVACGFSGHGFKFVPVVGEIVTELVVDGATRHPIGRFDPARFADPARIAGTRPW
jgi:sarcosine oxidase